MLKSSDATVYSDTDCWRALRAGEAVALGVLSTRYYRDLYHYGTKFTTNLSLIEDVLQDLFLGIWEKRAAQPTIESIKAYLFTSLRHNLLHQIQRASRLTSLEDWDEPEESEFSPEYQFIRTETDQHQHQYLTDALALLPRRQREAVYLKYYEELSYDEIAGIMGLSRQVVANYLHQAIQTLRTTCRYLILVIVFDLLTRL